VIDSFNKLKNVILILDEQGFKGIFFWRQRRWQAVHSFNTAELYPTKIFSLFLFPVLLPLWSTGHP
jgi:hypothetical protein